MESGEVPRGKVEKRYKYPTIQRSSGPRNPGPGWILDRHLVKDLTLARELPILDVPNEDPETLRRSRYWNLIQDDDKFWLIGKGIRSDRGSLQIIFGNCTSLEKCKPKFYRGPFPELAQNLGIFVSKDTGVIGIGGEAGDHALTLEELAIIRPKRNRRGQPDQDGVWIAKAPSLEDFRKSGWTLRIPAFTGFQQGCVEIYKPCCEFDSKFSIAPLHDRIFVYARANLNETGGGRYVQVTSVPRREFRTGRSPSGRRSLHWDSFQLIQFANRHHQTRSPLGSKRATLDDNNEIHNNHVDLSLAPQCDRQILDHYSKYQAHSENDIYLFPVNPHPLNDDILLALFPMTLNNGCGLMAIAISLDGIRFSAPHPILASETFRDVGRTFDHPVDGFLTSRSGLLLENIAFLMQINVFDIAGSNRSDYPPRFAQLSFSLKALRIYTDRAVAEWIHAFGPPPVWSSLRHHRRRRNRRT